MIVLVYCILSLFNCMLCLCCPPPIHTLMARYSLFVLKVPLNDKQTQQTRLSLRSSYSRHFTASLLIVIWFTLMWF